MHLFLKPIFILKKKLKIFLVNFFRRPWICKKLIVCFIFQVSGCICCLPVL